MRTLYCILGMIAVIVNVSVGARANDYVIQNNTIYPQFVRFVYTSPIGQGPLSFTIQAHGQRSDTFNAPGYTALVEIDAGPYQIFHNGQRWNAPIVFGDGPTVSPSGTYALIPPPPGQPTSSPSTPTHPSQPPPPPASQKWNTLLPTNSADNTITLKQLTSFTLPPGTAWPFIAVGKNSLICDTIKYSDSPHLTYFATGGLTNFSLMTNLPPGVPHITGDGNVYLDINTNVYLSEDGLKWKDILNTTSGLILVYWENQDLVLRNPSELFVSHDFGKTWDIEPLPPFFFNMGYSSIWGDKGAIVASVVENVNSVPNPPYQPRNDMIYALVISYDDGKTWSVTDLDSPQWENPIQSLFGAGDGVIAYVAVNNVATPWPYVSYIHESWDNGKTWEIEPYPDRITAGGDIMLVSNGYILIVSRPASYNGYLRNGYVCYAKRKGEGWHHIELDSIISFSMQQQHPMIVETADYVGPQQPPLAVIEVYETVFSQKSIAH